MADSDGFESADEDSIHSLEKLTDEELKESQKVSEAKPAAEKEECTKEVNVISKQPDDEIKPDPLVEKAIPTPPPDVWGWGTWSNWAATSMSSVADIANKTS